MHISTAEEAKPEAIVKDDKGKSARHDVVMQEKARLLKERRLARWADWKAADRPSLPELVR